MLNRHFSLHSSSCCKPNPNGKSDDSWIDYRILFLYFCSVWDCTLIWTCCKVSDLTISSWCQMQSLTLNSRSLKVQLSKSWLDILCFVSSSLLTIICSLMSIFASIDQQLQWEEALRFRTELVQLNWNDFTVKTSWRFRKVAVNMKLI